MSSTIASAASSSTASSLPAVSPLTSKRSREMKQQQQQQQQQREEDSSGSGSEEEEEEGSSESEYEQEEGSSSDDDEDDGSSESSESSSGEDDDDDDDEEEEQWSLRVRLLSAVDLPPSLSPNVPLCPWFKLGLVEDITAAINNNNNNITNNHGRHITNTANTARRAKEEERKKRVLRPKSERDDHDHDDDHEDGDNNDDLFQTPQQNDRKGIHHSTKPPKITSQLSSTQSSINTNNSSINTNNSSNNNTNNRINNNNNAQTLLQNLPPQQTRCSTSKLIMPHRGTGAEWNEEYRWNSLTSPMESVLAVSLVTRLGPENTIGGGGGGGYGTYGVGGGMSGNYGGNYGVGGMKRNASHGGLNSMDGSLHGESLHGGPGSHHNNNHHNHNHHHNHADGAEDTNELSHLGAGIKGLWRKGRQQLEEHRRRATITANMANSREERAATVAQFLMKRGDDGMGATAISNSTTHSTNAAGAAAGGGGGGGGASLFGQKDLVDYQQKWSDKKKEGGATMGDRGDDNPRNDDDNDGAIRPTDDATTHESEEGFDNNNDNNNDDDEDEYQQSEGLCLGTLTIPLSRLPLEDAFCGNSAAVVERWYQLDDPNLVSNYAGMGNNSSDDSGADGTIRGGSDVSSSSAGGEGRLLSNTTTATTSTTTTGSSGNTSSYPPPSPGLLPHGPRRCPSVLLEITFASADYLDAFEDEIHGGGNQGVENNATNIWDLTTDLQGGGGGGRGMDQKIMEKEEEKQKTGMVLSSSSQQQTNNNDASSATATSDAAAAREVEVSPKAEATTPAKKDNRKLSKADRPKPEDPELDSGVVDFVCIVGARDIGNQRNDDGSKGWVESTPECCVLERFPPDDEFHVKNGRNTALIPQVEWFCFPEGCKLWRGSHPPTRDDLKSGGVSSITRPSLDTSSAVFDSYLGSTSSFSWFVLSTNSDDYGSKLVKTYGASVRFYVPAPKGIDPTQDDFAQTIGGFGGMQKGKNTSSDQKRLWVPIGICLTSTLPIIGVVEEILLRMCNAMSTKLSSIGSSKLLSSSSGSPSVTSKLFEMLQKDLFHLVVNFSSPLSGVVHCSIPFLEGERLHITTSPPNGLPDLPHGGAVASTCRLLGAEGLTLLLAATLTECKIVIHSVNVANVAMVAEVISALIFPFTWQLPYIPILPKDMLEFLEAPLSFFVGIPTANLKFVDKNVLSEMVVVDLDDIASSIDYEGRRGPRTKIPSALPASVSTSISKAVFRLLREEDDLEAQMSAGMFPGCRRSPRLENESLPERKFRIYVALQICSLVRGYQECLFFVSASQPVFNRDRFLRQAPALFEEKRQSVLVDGTGHFSDRGSLSQKILSPRSKRFLSLLVNSQHFHQLLERLSSEETAFFHEVMESIEPEEDHGTGSKAYFSTSFGSSACEEAAGRLYDSLERIEQKIPTFRVDRERRPGSSYGTLVRWEEDDDEFKLDYDLGMSDIYFFDNAEKITSTPFTHNMLQPIMAGKNNDSGLSSGEDGVHALSLEYLVELEKNPWRYSEILEMSCCSTDTVEDKSCSGESKVQQEQNLIQARIKLREAIGERRFRAWKIANDHKDDDGIAPTTPVVEKTDLDKAFDLSSILSNVPELPLEGTLSGGGYETQPHVDANNRNKVRHILELAFGSGETNFQENGRDLIVEAELALRNPSAQRYLFSVLSQRTRIENQRRKRSSEDSKQRLTNQQSVSRLEPDAFECIVRLCYAVLEACMEEQNYESAYRLLTYTGGFCTATGLSSYQSDQKTIYMTARIKIHPIFADLRLWERVLLLHQQDQQNDRKEDASSAEQNGEESSSSDAAETEDTSDNDAYDAAVSTLYEMVGYGVPAEELARFATRISEEKGWFATEKGQALLVLARRLTAKRDEGGEEKSAGAGDLALGSSGVGSGQVNSLQSRDRTNSSRTDLSPRDLMGGGVVLEDVEATLDSEEIAWAHPSTSLVTSERHGLVDTFLGNIMGGAPETRTPGAAKLNVVNKAEGIRATDNTSGIVDAKGYAGRVAITAMASFGPTAVVTGGVDGSIFLAHTIHFGADRNEFESTCAAAKTSACSSPLHDRNSLVGGVMLQWGAKGDADRELGSGSISCLAASKGAGFRLGGGPDKSNSQLGQDGCADEDEIISSMEGCRVIAGTTGGGLRVWSLKDIYSASCMSRLRSGPDPSSTSLNRSHHGYGANAMTSSIIRPGADDSGMQDAVKGLSIGGHRGGVTCIDVPPRMYRPDALLSGGEDGLIKLWSLRTPSLHNSEGVAHNAQNSSIQSRFFSNQKMSSVPGDSTDTLDAQGVLAGHEGKILCIKTAWHGDKLLSGGADKTVRLWDLSGTGGKPLTTLNGHQGWVTQTHFWGPHIIVSASTDRSIALWDTRAGSSPLFALRYHLSPVSDLLLGNRSEPLMVSAGADGSLATWDFRVLSGSSPESCLGGDVVKDTSSSSRTIRAPIARMNHLGHSKKSLNCGSVKLSRAVGRHDFTFFSVCDDGIINEWDASSGVTISSHKSGHRDTVSGFSAFSSTDGLRHNKSNGRGCVSCVGGTLTCSWDGTIRLRRLSRKLAR